MPAGKQQTCPLCGGAIAAAGLDALGKHFESCPQTDRLKEPADGTDAPRRATGQE